jgi:diguanylate cyclase (GGDEF)-like protein
VQIRVRTYFLALIGLCTVILGIGGFALWSAATTKEAALQSTRATRVANAYGQARFAMISEESLERKYRLEPVPAIRKEYKGTTEAFVSALANIRSLGGPTDVRLVARLATEQRGYLKATARLFAAVDAHQTTLVLAIDSNEVDPTFGRIVAQVERASRAHAVAANGKLHSLRTSEQRVLVGTTIAIALGLALLGLFAVMLVNVNRQLRRQAAASEHEASHDNLTGLPNRTLLVDRMQELIATDPPHPEPFSLMMIDLDRFKEINDTLGHHTGDLLLEAIGPRILPLLRQADTLARLSGDEFAVLLPAVDTAAARKLAERVLIALRAPLALPNFVTTIDSSIGIVTYPPHGEDTATLLQHADVAMYLAKAQRSGNAIYDPEHDPYDPRRLGLIADLRDAVAAEAIDVHYQAKFDVRTLRAVGVEALARWNHPARGMISPDEFIPLAEHTGTIKKLTEHVLRQAVRQCRTWLDEGRDLPVSVNLSVANLLDIDLVPTVRLILEEERLAPEHLQFEITESVVMVDAERAEDILLELAGMGIGLAIDDFGTGYSSLAYLRRLPVQELKIDRSFVLRLGFDDEDAAIVRATIDLGHSLGLTVVAEGVEDARALRRLRELRCDTLQGFHLCRPQAAKDVIATLDELQHAFGQIPAFTS